jgi:acetamidase/formamidase
MAEIIKMRADLGTEKKTGHTLTGPIYVNGAEPGDVLEIKILKLVPRPYAVNYFMPGSTKLGTIPEDYPDAYLKHLSLDLKTMTTQFGPNIVVPLHPFFGIMAVAPAQDGRVSTAPPNDFGGNMDCKELQVGATLYLPVFKQGALFVYGDAHAGQGDGEVDLTAMEIAMDKAVFQFTVRKDMKLTKPFAETATHWIAFGFDPDLNVAAQKALREAIAFLVKQKGLTPADAYVLSSIALDLHVTQTVDGNKGIHVMIPKSIFKK